MIRGSLHFGVLVLVGGLLISSKDMEVIGVCFESDASVMSQHHQNNSRQATLLMTRNTEINLPMVRGDEYPQLRHLLLCASHSSGRKAL
ncbi:hypothetical protein M501DRAFT_995817 [Patellaria atrata CBS 101060]|uniref:Secreted protein n=1 Tax=Patellaria atrata CBS 101060 TaxID=1346257 RepID=A0A9P4VR73_9PEZI|nr:hypothetical protein M501DRAFT_995817 [Patellaria atrata CBS 101060]